MRFGTKLRCPQRKSPAIVKVLQTCTSRSTFEANDGQAAIANGLLCDCLAEFKDKMRSAAVPFCEGD